MYSQLSLWPYCMLSLTSLAKPLCLTCPCALLYAMRRGRGGVGARADLAGPYLPADADAGWELENEDTALVRRQQLGPERPEWIQRQQQEEEEQKLLAMAQALQKGRKERRKEGKKKHKKKKKVKREKARRQHSESSCSSDSASSGASDSGSSRERRRQRKAKKGKQKKRH